MSWGSLIKVAGLASVVALLAATVWLAVDRFDQKAVADAARACEAAASSPTAVLDHCGPKVAARIIADRQTIVCEGALLPELTPKSRFTALQTCEAGVLRLIAVGDAQSGELAAVRQQLALLQADAGASIARAEARGRTEQTRRDNAQRLIQAAPRGADGGIVCDADCLRKLAE